MLGVLCDERGLAVCGGAAGKGIQGACAPMAELALREQRGGDGWCGRYLLR